MVIANILIVLSNILFKIILPCAIVYWIIKSIAERVADAKFREYDRKLAEQELNEIEKELNSKEP